MANKFDNKMREWAELYSRNNFYLALDEIEDAAKNNPSNPIIQLFYAMTQIKVSKYQQAQETLTRLSDALFTQLKTCQPKDKALFNEILIISKDMLSRMAKRDYSLPINNPKDWLQQKVSGGISDVPLAQDKNVSPPVPQEPRIRPIRDAVPSKSANDKVGETFPRYKPVSPPGMIPPASKPPMNVNIPPPLTPIDKGVRKDAAPKQEQAHGEGIAGNNASTSDFIKRITVTPEELTNKTVKPPEFIGIKKEQTVWHSETAEKLASMQNSGGDVFSDLKLGAQNKGAPDASQTTPKEKYHYDRKRQRFEQWNKSNDKPAGITEFLKKFYPGEIAAIIVALIAFFSKNFLFAIIGIYLAIITLNKKKIDIKRGISIPEFGGVMAVIALILVVLSFFFRR